MNKIINSIFDKDFIMKQSLKYVEANRQRLRNDRPFKYWALNQDIYINITVIMWLIWQAWSLSVIFAKPTPINDVGEFDFYLTTVFWKLANLINVSPQNSNIVGVLFLPESFIFLTYTIILLIFSIYTIAVTSHYISDIRKAVKINEIKTWNRKINIFLIIMYAFVIYGLIMFVWLLFGMYYIPFSLADQQIETLVYSIPPRVDINKIPIVFNSSGYPLIISNFINLFLLITLYTYYLHQRFIGYRYFFSFEKKEWKKIDYIGESMKWKEKYKLKNFNKPHKGSKIAVNNEDYVIEIKNANKYFLSNFVKLRALKDINLKIKEGEFVVILGPSGSGKTTLLNIISGVDRPTDGQIVVANHNIINMDAKALTKYRREKTGYIFQQYSLLPNLTIKENVMIGYYLGGSRKRSLDKKVYLQNVKKANGKQKIKVTAEYIKNKIASNSNKNKIVNDILKLLGLDVHANKYPSQLSGGQQQRVAIARAFVKRPDILFGDEPTGAIDVEMSKQILELFYLINKVAKTTVLMVTHNPKIAEMASRIIEVHNGKIVRNQIISNPKRVDQIDWN